MLGRAVASLACKSGNLALAAAAALVLAVPDGPGAGRALTPSLGSPAARSRSVDAAVTCAKITDPSQLAAIAEAERLLHRQWLKTRSSLFVAFAAKVEKRNPFDLSPRPPAGAAAGGFVEAMEPRCALEAPASPDGFLVRFTAPFYRFHEPDTGWSRPLRNGLVLEAHVRRTDDAWQARDTKPDVAIVEPDEAVRRPIEAELPKAEPWAEPVPGCSRRERWTGTECARRKR
jgi:hypothetical protein